MTVEQLNIIITAQTADFQEKLAAVNVTLRETMTLARQAAEAAASITGASVSFELDGQEEQAAAAVGSAENARTAAAGTGIPAAPAHRGKTAGNVYESYASFEDYLAAKVPELDKGGGFGTQESGAAKAGYTQPIEIHTTVELDGDRLGEAIAAYNSRVSRITDGFYSK